MDGDIVGMGGKGAGREGQTLRTDEQAENQAKL